MCITNGSVGTGLVAYASRYTLIHRVHHRQVFANRNIIMTGLPFFSRDVWRLCMYVRRAQKYMYSEGTNILIYVLRGHKYCESMREMIPSMGIVQQPRKLRKLEIGRADHTGPT